jgi:hypothetical protein
MSENPLKLKFNEWSEWLDGSLPDSQVDRNSISGVIYTVVQEMAIFEAYAAICKANPKSPLATPLFWRSKTFSYFETQSMNIRKLTEVSNKPMFTSNNTDVYSMGRLIIDIKEQTNNGTLTRENLCLVYDIPPTKEETEKQYNEALQSLGSGGGGDFRLDLIHAVRQHGTLDVICHDNGKLRRALLKKLSDRLLPEFNNHIRTVKGYTDKYLAHSATQASRDELQEEIKLYTSAVDEAIKGLVECFYFFELFIKRAGYAGLIPVGWDSYLGNLSAEETKIVTEVFKDVETKCKEWEKSALDWLGINS